VAKFGLPTVLFLIFLTLKLSGHIDWSWWWVFAPFWGIVVLVVILILLALWLDSRLDPRLNKNDGNITMKRWK